MFDFFGIGIELLIASYMVAPIMLSKVSHVVSSLVSVIELDYPVNRFQC